MDCAFINHNEEAWNDEKDSKKTEVLLLGVMMIVATAVPAGSAAPDVMVTVVVNDRGSEGGDQHSGCNESEDMVVVSDNVTVGTT